MISTINQYLYEANREFGINMMKVDAFLEATERQLNINYQEAELKVLQEHGTDNDLVYLYKEASNGVIESLKKAIKNIIDAFVKFFSNLKNKIVSKITGKDLDEKMNKLDKTVKLNPLLGKKKIIIENTDAQIKNADEHISKFNKLLAKAKAGQKVTPEEVDEVNKSFMDKHRKLVGVGAAITVTLLSAIGLLMKRKSKLSNDINNTYKEGNKILLDISKMLSTTKSSKKLTGPSNSLSRSGGNSNIEVFDSIGDFDIIDVDGNLIKTDRIQVRIGSCISKCLQTKASSLSSGVSGVLNSIKKGITGVKNTKVNAIESVLDDDMSLDKDDDMFKDSDSPSINMSEDSDFDDPMNYIQPPTDDNGTDPWDDVMKSDTDDTFESAYMSLFDDIISEPCDCAFKDGKPSNDEIVKGLYDDIMTDVKCKNKSKQYCNTNESAFDRLMSDMDFLY